MPIVSIREVTTTQGKKKKGGRKSQSSTALVVSNPAVRTKKRKSRGRVSGGDDSTVMQCCKLVLCGIANAFGKFPLQRLPTGCPAGTYVERFKVRTIIKPKNGNITITAFPGLPGGLVVAEGIIEDYLTIDGVALVNLDAGPAGGNVGIPFTEFVDSGLGGTITPPSVGASYAAQEARCLGFGMKVLPLGAVLNMTGRAVALRQHAAAAGVQTVLKHSYTDPVTSAPALATINNSVPSVVYRGLNSASMLDFNTVATATMSEEYSLVPGVDKRGTGRYFPGTCENFGKFTQVATKTQDNHSGGVYVNNSTFCPLAGETRLPVDGGLSSAWGGIINGFGTPAIRFPLATGAVEGPPVYMMWMEENVNTITWLGRGLPADSPFEVEFAVNMEMILDPTTSPRRKALMPGPRVDREILSVAQTAQEAMPLAESPGVVDRVVDAVGNVASHPYIRQMMAEGSRRWSDNLYKSIHARLFNNRGASGTGYWGDALGLE